MLFPPTDWLRVLHFSETRAPERYSPSLAEFVVGFARTN
jgi:hypothetical protein